MILKKRAQYQAVYRAGRGCSDGLVTVKKLHNGLKVSRYGFSVSKEVGKAVVRNRVRRLLKELARLVPVKPGWDVVFIAHPKAGMADYHDLKNSVNGVLARADLLRDNDEIVGLGAN